MVLATSSWACRVGLILISLYLVCRFFSMFISTSLRRLLSCVLFGGFGCVGCGMFMVCRPRKFCSCGFIFRWWVFCLLFSSWRITSFALLSRRWWWFWLG